MGCEVAEGILNTPKTNKDTVFYEFNYVTESGKLEKFVTQDYSIY